MAYHQFSANDIFSLSLVQRKTFSSIERRFGVHSNHRMPISCKGQALWRKIQVLELFKICSERDSDTAKWLSHTLGLAYLDPQEVKDSFVFDIMPDA